ncbi:IS66 family insertion sequence element accessory protein TnpB (plasmid) [Enterobacter bugandensis]|uniref:IS66 family insertion sequence element accessory protein TnpB n=1 Tax=Enterobacter bugandensis TaxID=881260 RepID=UPI00283AB51D|nr:IS66 family insertion sequence element accessory protein TnpB [Enterobacter bugandensis]WMU75422.1 IS66 family insertion sequence element accessory protein TnpB [Enterobacter bugandensis]WMU75428.1 IS66 family insertion sequence element accessory protein TnpB [Enterobacter bugandensis]WMU75436.1 IS66 family insertion sequence element accessory protein TnpB [Enterobacter bugandensis]
MSKKYMTAAQRRCHYHDWLTSGMTRADYARLHGIHAKTFGNLCRDIAAEGAAKAAPPEKNALPLLPVTLAIPVETDTVTLSLRRASVTGTAAALIPLIRELNLC